MNKIQSRLASITLAVLIIVQVTALSVLEVRVRGKVDKQFAYNSVVGLASVPSLTAWAFVVPTIDGVLSPGEWDEADSENIVFQYSDLSPETSAHNATIYVKNDGRYLYLAVTVKWDDFNPNDFCNWWFENDYDGVIEVGDDGLSVRGDGLSTDLYRSKAVEGWWSSDAYDGGTNDIVGAANHTNPSGTGDYTFEYRHPLDTADNAHDFTLKPDDTVGFQLQYADGGPTGRSDEWPGLPNYGAIVIATRPTYVVSVRVQDEWNAPMEGALVHLDGVHIGKSNIEGELKINDVTMGVHVVLVTKENHLNSEETINVTSNMTVTVKLLVNRINLNQIIAIMAGIAATSGAAIAIAKMVWPRAKTRMIRGKLEEREMESLEEKRKRERRRKKREEPKLVWTLSSPSIIPSGGHVYVHSEIKNIGEAPATGVEIDIRGSAELKFDSPLKIGDIRQNTSKRISIKMECTKKVSEERRSLMFKLVSNETHPQTIVRAVRFEPLRVGLLRDSHNISYSTAALQKQGERLISPDQLQAWLKEKKFDYGVVEEAEDSEALKKYQLILASSQYALSDKDVADLRKYIQDGRGLVALDGVGTIDAGAFRRGESNYGGERRIYELYGYSGPDIAIVEKGLKGIRIVEDTHPITRGYRSDELLPLPTQKGIVFTQPVLKAKMLADQRVSVKGKPGYLGIPGLTVQIVGSGRVVHFNFCAENVIEVISELMEKAILWAAGFNQ